MTNDMMLGGVYVLMAAMLVLGSLMQRREPWSRVLTMALAWIGIFGAGFILFTFRDNVGWVSQRLKAEAFGTPVNQGKELRIPMAIDGHFWVEGEINGVPVKFLVDSGATMTTISAETARQASVTRYGQGDQIVRTGNGLVRVSSGRADRLNVGTITRDKAPLHIANEDFSVLGMSFLSTLSRWSVEGRWLVLVD